MTGSSATLLTPYLNIRAKSAKKSEIQEKGRALRDGKKLSEFLKFKLSFLKPEEL
ncbi:hypothetical protein [Methanosarcina horonobensis]|uniref:hypothetical protein n=1 Tax=Methanosarcina horonobensis TaxID=418008 RepID=UPI000B26A8FD|nr:hypothetical protein [Methanosarcina horonobensis]